MWEAMANALRGYGYSVATGILSAEQFGVPQTRRRAFLLASLDGPVSMPRPTHQRYVAPRKTGPERYRDAPAPAVLGGNGSGELAGGSNSRRARQAPPPEPHPTLFEAPEPERIVLAEDVGLLPWVSMAQALSWGATARPSLTVTTPNGAGASTHILGGGSGSDAATTREREAGRWIEGPSPSPSVTGGGGATGGVEVFASKAARARAAAAVQFVALRTGNFTARDHRGQRGVPYERPATEPAPTIRGAGIDEWVTERPATTVNGDPRISEPGRHDPEVSGSQQANAVRVSIAEAAVLQSFPADFPWQGSKTAIYQQIGNAVCPLLAWHVLGAIPSVKASRSARAA